MQDKIPDNSDNRKAFRDFKRAVSHYEFMNLDAGPGDMRNETEKDQQPLRGDPRGR